jgi:hypothetical protein
LQFVIDDPAEVARRLAQGARAVQEFRREYNDSYNFNWLMSIQPQLQRPFQVSHESMRELSLTRAQPAHLLASNLRRAFSGIVTGNVKDHGVHAIEKQGPYELTGDSSIMKLMDELLSSFVAQGRMKLPGGEAYRPCYRLAG